jgi:hypothetical protein
VGRVPVTDRGDNRRVACRIHAGRVISVDPSLVWALVADPARTGEWAAVETVGYMGTELPKPGQAVFIKRSWQRRSRARRVEIENWEAGSSYRCNVATPPFRTPVEFALHITPEVTGAGIATKVGIDEALQLPRLAVAPVRLYVRWALERKLDRIAKRAAL